MNKMIVTGAGGLIGSEMVEHFCSRGWKVTGIDNNMRMDFFGPSGDIRWNLARLSNKFPDLFSRSEIDIRSRDTVTDLVAEVRPSVIIHAAAQPSHDLAAKRPFDDFDVNAVGTLNLLEATRQFSVNTVFIYLSTNKVYGDAPNKLALKELEKRWDYADPGHFNGIDESFGIDQNTHSLFGASKLAADIMVQEYGRYFGMSTCCLRGGCLTGPNHTGVQAHGFLNFLIRSNVLRKKYTIFGYKGKQVRDNIHAADVARFAELFIEDPRSGEVYNIGGGRNNSVSILEAFDLIERISGIATEYDYSDAARKGDHICYITDLTKIKRHYPSWEITFDLEQICRDIYRSVKSKSTSVN